MEELLKRIEESFFKFYENDKKITSLYRKARDGTADYEKAHEFAVRIGNSLAKAYKSNLEVSLMDYETALKMLNDPLKRNYSLIAKYCTEVQLILNKKYGLDINFIKPEFSNDRVEGLAKAISESSTGQEAIKYFGEQVINFSQSVVDDAVERNASFAAEIGFKPQIIRTYEGPHEERGKTVDCEWCKNLEGTYDYEEVKAAGSDIYKRHEGCRCTVTYVPVKNEKAVMRQRGNAFTSY